MTDTKVHVQQCSLHTEKPEWAAKALDQIEAALQRGGLAIGFTEVHTNVIDMVAFRDLCSKYGYELLYYSSDSALAYSTAEGVEFVESGEVPTVAHRSMVWVTLTVNGETITVVEVHFQTKRYSAQRPEQAAALAAFVADHADAKKVVFWMGDLNAEYENKDDDMRVILSKAGLVTTNEALDQWAPTHGPDTDNGVVGDVVGFYDKDVRVHVESMEVHDKLGSDHHPVSAYFSVAHNVAHPRRRHHRHHRHHRR